MSETDQRCADLVEFISDTLLEDPGSRPSVSESLFKSQLLDSLALTMLIAHVEEQYAIKVKSMDIVYENFDTVENISNYIDTRLR